MIVFGINIFLSRFFFFKMCFCKVFISRVKGMFISECLYFIYNVMVFMYIGLYFIYFIVFEVVNIMKILII